MESSQRSLGYFGQRNWTTEDLWPGTGRGFTAAADYNNRLAEAEKCQVLMVKGVMDTGFKEESFDSWVKYSTNASASFVYGHCKKLSQ